MVKEYLELVLPAFLSPITTKDQSVINEQIKKKEKKIALMQCSVGNDTVIGDISVRSTKFKCCSINISFECLIVTCLGDLPYFDKRKQVTKVTFLAKEHKVSPISTDVNGLS